MATEIRILHALGFFCIAPLAVDLGDQVPGRPLARGVEHPLRAPADTIRQGEIVIKDVAQFRILGAFGDDGVEDVGIKREWREPVRIGDTERGIPGAAARLQVGFGELPLA